MNFIPPPCPPGSLVIPVCWHVIAKDTSREGGSVTDLEIQRSLDVLNSDYANTGVSFVHQCTTRHLSAYWFDNAGIGDPAQDDMKSALRTGDALTLNVYTVGFTKQNGLLGYATFPCSYTSNPKDDGVVILHSTVPGGTSEPFNLGRVRLLTSCKRFLFTDKF